MELEHSQHERQRPHWASAIHNFGDDLRWAVSGWCDFPRPARRFVGGLTTTVAAHAFGAQDVVASIVSSLS